MTLGTGPGAERDAVLRRENLFFRFFDGSPNGIIITDPTGVIVHLNPALCHFLEVEPQDQIGRHCTEVIDNTRLHIVGRSGRAELNQIQEIRGIRLMVDRIPVRRCHRGVAVLGRVLFGDFRRVHRKSATNCASYIPGATTPARGGCGTCFTFDSIVGKSDAMARVRTRAWEASANCFPVLIQGESGTGKELFAHAIHHHGPRKDYPFIKVKFAAFAQRELCTELFGPKRGVFTGNRDNPGKFEMAHGGTLFLDEIADLPFGLQERLLRVIREKAVEQPGGSRIIPVDLRIIATTNQDLSLRIKEGLFRQELYDRLNVVSLALPPLRERTGDVGDLAVYLLGKIARRAGSPPPEISPGAMARLEAYPFPGNVRELANILESAFALCDGEQIRTRDLPFVVTAS